MKDLDKVLYSEDENKNEDELKKSLKVLFNEELRTEIKDELNKNYKFTKDEYSSDLKNKQKISSIKNILLFLLLLSIIAFAIYKLLPAKNSEEKAMQYVSNDVIEHPGLLKGNNNDSLLVLAITTYNDKDWKAASAYFQQINPPTSESLFYNGLSNLYANNYRKAIEYLSNPSLKNSNYNQEVNWFLSLAYLLNGEKQMAIQSIKNIKANGWRYKESQDLLSSIK